MKKITFLLLVFEVLYSCTKPSSPLPTPTHTDTLPTGHIIYNEYTGSHASLVEVNPDGSGRKVLVNDSVSTDLNLINSIPTWAFEGPTLLFSSINNGGGTTLYSVDSNGHNLNAINFSTSNTRMNPVPSPDGKKIAFIGVVGHSSQLFVANRDGSLEQQLTSFTSASGNITATAPRWNSDGSTLYFSDNYSGTYNIYSIGVDGTNLKPITSTQLYPQLMSSISKTGKILYSAGLSPYARIHVMNADGSQDQQLTSFNSLSAVWSPDGNFIAFTSTKDKTSLQVSDLYVMKADGTQINRITNTDLNKPYLDWR